MEWKGKKKKTINAIVSAEQKNIEARTKEKEKQTNVGAKVRETECRVFKELH